MSITSDMTVRERIEELRRHMAQREVEAYIIVTDDFHGSEYVGDYFKEREFMSGFTGSAGTLVVCSDWAGLWTDGRYFLQAEEQLSGSGICLMKIGEEGVPAIDEFLEERLEQNSRIGFDARTVSNAFARRLREKLEKKQISLCGEMDLAGDIWKRRPAISKEPVWELPVKYAGTERSRKLATVREKMEQEGCQAMVLTALDEIAWLLNLRGNDVQSTPVFLAYMTIGEDAATLFVHREIISDGIAQALAADGIGLEEYDTVYSRLSAILADKRVLIDGDYANYRIMSSIPGTATVIDKPSPVILMKAVKNPVELENIKRAHILDGVAVTRFIFWLQHNASRGITELEAAAKLEALRGLAQDYLGPSFEPIIAYGNHGAIIHYEPTPQSDAVMSDRGFCLADTGGHYLCGTTDVTRTVPLGALSSEEKRAYTLVLRGHLNLGSAHFSYGISGANLDCLARGPLWENGMDYNHGTGHGVGFLLSVHEGPQRFHWRIRGGEPVRLEEGMILSNEPGYYVPGKFGIRHENLMVVRRKDKTEYGQFMYLENLTMVPFDKAAIDKSLLSDRDIERLNAYHQRVFHEISGYFEGEELEWLKKVTQPL